MPDEFGYTLGEEAPDQLGRVVAEHARRVVRPIGGQGRRPNRQGFIEGVLLDQLTPCLDLETGQTCARLQLLWGAPAIREDEEACADDGILTDDEAHVVSVVNRSYDLSADVGTYVIAAWINGQWRPIWIDCNAGDVSLSVSDEGGGGGGGGYGDGGYGDGGLGG